MTYNGGSGGGNRCWYNGVGGAGPFTVGNVADLGNNHRI